MSTLLRVIKFIHLTPTTRETHYILYFAFICFSEVKYWVLYCMLWSHAVHEEIWVSTMLHTQPTVTIHLYLSPMHTPERCSCSLWWGSQSKTHIIYHFSMGLNSSLFARSFRAECDNIRHQFQTAREWMNGILHINSAIMRSDTSTAAGILVIQLYSLFLSGQYSSCDFTVS